jgi:hypothetical protein
MVKKQVRGDNCANKKMLVPRYEIGTNNCG